MKLSLKNVFYENTIISETFYMYPKAASYMYSANYFILNVAPAVARGT